jgi:hypothetical protein
MKSSSHYSCLRTALLVVLLALCFGASSIAEAGAAHPFFIGALRPGIPDYRAGSAEGYLLVYSATDEFDDGDVAFYAHSSYSIYTADGKLFKNVENHISRSDEIPELVTLPPGSYTVEARSTNKGCVRVRVMIKAARRTVLDLDKGV